MNTSIYKTIADLFNANSDQFQTLQIGNTIIQVYESEYSHIEFIVKIWRIRPDGEAVLQTMWDMANADQLETFVTSHVDRQIDAKVADKVLVQSTRVGKTSISVFGVMVEYGYGSSVLSHYEVVVNDSQSQGSATFQSRNQAIQMLHLILSHELF